MIKQITRAVKNFMRENDIPEEQRTLVSRAVRHGYLAGDQDNARHRRVRRSFRGIIARQSNVDELPY